MELRKFNSLSEAEAWYQRPPGDRDSAVDEISLTLCRGDDERAQSLYRETTFPSRWWADIAYMQGHYLIRLRRRDRLIDLARQLDIDIGLSTSDNPWADLQFMADFIKRYASSSS